MNMLLSLTTRTLSFEFSVVRNNTMAAAETYGLKATVTTNSTVLIDVWLHIINVNFYRM